MIIKELELENFRGIRHMTLPFEEGLTMLHGKNGSGKSTILHALAYLLSWTVARIEAPKNRGKIIADRDVNNDASWTSLDIKTSVGDWRLLHTRKGRFSNAPKTNLSEVNAYAKSLRQSQDDPNAPLPLLVFYPVHRAVLDVPLRIRSQHEFLRVDALDGSLESGVDFRRFFEWFRDREDLENEHKRDGEYEFIDAHLEAIRNAMTSFLPEFKDLKVKRKPLRMVVTKREKELQIEQLSDGEKTLLALVSDLARRLAIANPGLGNPLLGQGVVLIDEVDLHLHPSWQAIIPARLRSTFPNCQFILSTHSEQVLGQVEAGCVRRLGLDEENGDVIYNIPDQSLGLAANDLLQEMMDAPIRDAETSRALEEIFALIDDDQFDAARKKIQAQESRLGGSIPETVRAATMIAMLDDSEQI